MSAVVEWFEGHLKEMGVSKTKTSKIIGRSREWMGQKCREDNLDMWEAIAILTDVGRHQQGKEPEAFARWRAMREKEKQKHRQTRKKQIIDDWERPFWDDSWEDGYE